MDGQVLLSHHTLDLLLFGMPMEKFTVEFWNLSGLSLICGNRQFVWSHGEPPVVKN